MTTSGVSGQWHPVSADRGAVEVFVRVPPLEQFAIKSSPKFRGVRWMSHASTSYEIPFLLEGFLVLLGISNSDMAANPASK
jgi:hypothetical protein